jgi:hypothetical protein
MSVWCSLPHAPYDCTHMCNSSKLLRSLQRLFLRIWAKSSSQCQLQGSRRENPRDGKRPRFQEICWELERQLRVREAGGCTSDKTDVFSTRTKNKVEKRISFFYWTWSFVFWIASALEERGDQAVNTSKSKLFPVIGDIGDKIKSSTVDDLILYHEFRETIATRLLIGQKT